MPYSVEKQKCKQSNGKKGIYIVKKKSTGKKSSCHTSKKKAQDSISARYASEITEDIIEEIKDYFRNQSDEDYLSFDNHPLSDISSLLDPTKPAPWDHLNNSEDDEDVDIEIEERIKD